LLAGSPGPRTHCIGEFHVSVSGERSALATFIVEVQWCGTQFYYIDGIIYGSPSLARAAFLLFARTVYWADLSS
jgi:hypothetical protein